MSASKLFTVIVIVVVVAVVVVVVVVVAVHVLVRGRGGDAVTAVRQRWCEASDGGVVFLGFFCCVTTTTTIVWVWVVFGGF